MEKYYFFKFILFGFIFSINHMGFKRCMYTYRVNLFKFIIKEKKTFV